MTPVVRIPSAIHPSERMQAANESNREAAAREAEERMARWSSTLQRALDLRCEGVVDETVWSEVRMSVLRRKQTMAEKREGGVATLS